MFGEKGPGEMTMYIGIKVIPRLFCSAFSFSPVLINVPNTFGKTYLTSKLLVSEKASNSGGLMFECR